MVAGEECHFVKLSRDDKPVVEIRGEEKVVELRGIEVIRPPPEEYYDIFHNRLSAGEPMKCVVYSTLPSGHIDAKLMVYGWLDKTGDAWLDLGLLLIDLKLARAAKGDYPEREEYIRHERHPWSYT